MSGPQERLFYCPLATPPFPSPALTVFAPADVSCYNALIASQRADILPESSLQAGFLSVKTG